MPIGDLLAQISGGQSSSTTTPVLQRSSTISKRKADDELRGSVSKTPRPNTPGSRPGLSSQPAARLAATPSRVSSNGHVVKPAAPPKRPNDATSGSRPTGSVRPAPAAANGAGPAKPPPKKGSFAEIMARAQRAQTVMGQVGKIQHKKIEGGSIAKRKDDAKSGPGPVPKGQGNRAPGYAGNARPSKQPNGSGGQNGVRNGVDPRSKPGSGNRTAAANKAAEQEQEKKFKKAAAATTGYTGTSRPRPGADVKKGNAQRGGALLNEPRSRPSSSKQSRYDDYDEDLDDFIDYDDEEEAGPRYDYASDGSSDMEAGLEDIDGEERKAEYIARREDVEEERLERSRKLAKEDRKRKALESLRAGRRN